MSERKDGGREGGIDVMEFLFQFYFKYFFITA